MREAKKQDYLRWAVDSFRLATAGAKSETQVHTHMCYCEFDDCIEAIDRMDTDVNSIENARSDNKTVKDFQKFGYKRGLGPGVYDIHSPVVPSVEFMKKKIKTFLPCIDMKHICVNPDCGTISLSTIHLTFTSIILSHHSQPYVHFSFSSQG